MAVKETTGNGRDWVTIIIREYRDEWRLKRWRLEQAALARICLLNLPQPKSTSNLLFIFVSEMSVITHLNEKINGAGKRLEQTALARICLLNLPQPESTSNLLFIFFAEMSVMIHLNEKINCAGNRLEQTALARTINYSASFLAITTCSCCTEKGAPPPLPVLTKVIATHAIITQTVGLSEVKPDLPRDEGLGLSKDVQPAENQPVFPRDNRPSESQAACLKDVQPAENQPPYSRAYQSVRKTSPITYVRSIVGWSKLFSLSCAVVSASRNCSACHAQ
ncbi:hypothetical protein J6590_081106 [Homalodisca vitripennis]|nr:hypothetical protein J6590_081106 [Homalodisca vitripennis]